MTFEDYRHFTNIQIRFKDVDKQGHVNNANHLTYFEMGRVDYFRDVVRRKIDWVKTGMILAKTEIDYKLPILLEDTIYCGTRIESFGTKSFVVKHALVKEESGQLQLAAHGRCVLVCMNYDTRETTPVPEEWRTIISAFEGLQ